MGVGAWWRPRSLGQAEESFGLPHLDALSLRAPGLQLLNTHTYTMLALRSLSRVASRPVARLSTKALRPPTALLRPTLLQPAAYAPRPRLVAAFHQSVAARQDSNQGTLFGPDQDRLLTL